MNAVEPKTFDSSEACKRWIDSEGIECCFPHPSRIGWIAVVADPRGMFAIVSADQMVLLEDW